MTLRLAASGAVALLLSACAAQTPAATEAPDATRPPPPDVGFAPW